MRRRKFKSDRMQAVYDLHLTFVPDLKSGGGSLSRGYWEGRNHPDKPCRQVRGSLAYAAWAAGQDVARADFP